MKFLTRLTKSSNDGGDDLGSFSDLMSALMLVFLLVSVALLSRTKFAETELENTQYELRAAQLEMDKLRAERDEYKPYHEAFETIETTRDSLAALLMSRITEADLARWRAEFDASNLSFRFNDPETLFSTGSAELTSTFESILSEFAPFLLDTLNDGEAYLDVSSIRIEGHTSSEWSGSSRALAPSLAHIRNMALSQARAFSVVQHLSEMSAIEIHWDHWTRQRIQALGIGPNRLIFDDELDEDSERSRRVEVWIVPRDTVRDLSFSRLSASGADAEDADEH